MKTLIYIGIILLLSSCYSENISSCERNIRLKYSEYDSSFLYYTKLHPSRGNIRFFKDISQSDTSYYLGLYIAKFRHVIINKGVVIYFEDKTNMKFPEENINTMYIKDGLFTANSCVKITSEQMKIFTDKPIELFTLGKAPGYLSWDLSRNYMNQAYCLIQY